MKLILDAAKCQGHGRCYDLAPQVFGEDEEGYAVLLGDGEVPDAEARAAGLAVRNCPENALLVAEDLVPQQPREGVRA